MTKAPAEVTTRTIPGVNRRGVLAEQQGERFVCPECRRTITAPPVAVFWCLCDGRFWHHARFDDAFTAHIPLEKQQAEVAVAALSDAAQRLRADLGHFRCPPDATSEAREWENTARAHLEAVERLQGQIADQLLQATVQAYERWREFDGGAEDPRP